MLTNKIQRVLTTLQPLWERHCGGTITLNVSVQPDALVHQLAVNDTLYGQIQATFDLKHQALAEVLFTSWMQLLDSLVESYATTDQLTQELIVSWDRLHFLNEISSVMDGNTTLWDVCIAALRLAAEVIGAKNGFLAHGNEWTWLNLQPEASLNIELMDALQQETGAIVHRRNSHGQDFVGSRLNAVIPAFVGLIHTTGFNAGDLQVFTSLTEQLRRLIDIERLHQEQREAQALQYELEIASQVQINFLPAQLPRLSGCDVAAVLLPASRVSGDFYDVAVVDETLHVMVCDVAGKGVAGALLAASVRGVMRSHLNHKAMPGQVLGQTNQLLYDDMTRSEKFATAILVSGSPTTSTWAYANAGHTTAFCLHTNPLHVEMLPSKTPPMGILPDIDNESFKLEMGENDVLVLYSDGLTEMTNNANRLLGMGTVTHALLATHSAPAQFILDSLVQIYQEHRGDKPIEDDLTLVVIKKVKTESDVARHFIRWEFPAQLDVAWRVESELNQLKAFLPQTESAKVWLIEVQLALTELFNNVVIHAYQGQRGYIHGLIAVQADHLRMELIDFGVTYKQPELKPLDIDSLPEGGYGMHLIHQIMDEVHYERLENGFNRWTLIRALPK